MASFEGDWPDNFGPAPANVVHIGAAGPREFAPIADDAADTPPIVASPFIWRAESEIPARQWLYGKHLLRRFVSLDVAAGGVGKSSVKIGEALAMTSGHNLYGSAVSAPLTVWLYNLEDPAEETERRIHATAKWFKIAPEEAGALYVDSGRDQRCVIASESEYGARIIQPIYEQIKAQLLACAVDVLIVDPFVSSHEVNENDNRAIDIVAKAWGRLADECNCSVNLVHHIRKVNGAEVTAESARGAKALVDAARSVNVYARMTADEAGLAGIAEDQRGFYFRVQCDKANLAPPEKATWYRMNNVALDNGDQVGVACPWEWPELFEGISTRHLIACQKAAANGEWRADPRSPEWVGVPIAKALDLDPEMHRKRIARLLAQWLNNGAFEIVEKRDYKGMPRKFVEVGKEAYE